MFVHAQDKTYKHHDVLFTFLNTEYDVPPEVAVRASHGVTRVITKALRDLNRQGWEGSVH